MTLICAECGNSLGRSDTLPGSEGVLIHPVIIGLAYMPIRDSTKIKYEPIHTQSPHNIAVCLECIQEKLPPDRKDSLNKIFAAYEAEMSQEEQKKKEAGMFFEPGQKPKWLEKYDIWKSARKLIPNECIFTGKPIVENEPYFVCYVIDRLNSDLGSRFFANLDGNKYGNYQVSGRLEESGTHFRISFNAMKENFPFSFKQLSCNMRGVRNPDDKRTSEILISPEVKAEFEKATGKSIAQLFPDGFGALGNELRPKDKMRNK